MDTNTIAVKTGLIQGPVGALYIDNDNNNVYEAVPVLFLHSFAGSSKHWKDQLDHLRTKRQATAFDFRAHGKSEAGSDSNYSVEALVKDVEAVVDSLGWDQVILVGHSMGASTALAYAAAHPKKVVALVLAGAPGRTDPAQAKQIVASLESNKYEQVMDEYMKRLLQGAKPPTDRIVMEGAQKLTKPVTIQIVKGQFAFIHWTELIRFTCPAMIIYTTGESKQPNALFHQAKDVPSRLIPETSHWIQMDKPDEFNQVLDSFLVKVDEKVELR
jgi:pimeloyl-ACP methyl ester carboxylesterase